ncbi:MAG: PspA/IM30 family protein [Chloroflexota bacterium]
MLRLIFRTWHYSVAFLSHIFDERADPRIQIEQAIEEAKRQHGMLAEQAAAVIGNQRELQLKIARGDADADRLDASAAKALRLADHARSKDDAQAAAGYERTAQLLASQLAIAQSSLADLRELHDRAAAGAGAARRALEQNAFTLQKQMAERSKLLTELEAARMQERMADALSAISAIAPAGTIPTLPAIREKIDRRIGRGAGRFEIARDGVESQLLEVERAVIDTRGEQLLDEIRRREGLAPAREE